MDVAHDRTNITYGIEQKPQILLLSKLEYNELKKKIFLIEYFPQNLFRQKYLNFRRNFSKDYISLEIFEFLIEFTHVQIFHRKG